MYVCGQGHGSYFFEKKMWWPSTFLYELILKFDKWFSMTEFWIPSSLKRELKVTVVILEKLSFSCVSVWLELIKIW